MPNFRYQSMTNHGESRSGLLTASNRADAVRQLTGRGETALLIEDESGAKASPRRNGISSRPKPARTTESFSSRVRRSRRPTIRRPDMANFIRELATALEAGLPLMQSLKTVRKQASGAAMPVILDHLIERVEAGDPLHKAARDYGPPFDDMIVGMLRAADASGRTGDVMHQLADLLERSVELRREVLGATLYPMIVAALIAISATILVTVLMPRLIEPLQDQITMPWPTLFLLNIATFIGSYWMLMVAAVFFLALGWRMWMSVPENRLRVDLLKLRTPVLGRLVRDVAVARFTRTLGTLTSSGLPILEALRITNATLGNAALVQAVEEVQEQVTAGKSIAEPMDRSGLFPPLLIQVINLGERSGKLDTMLIHAATAFDRQVNNSIKLFTKALPPLLLIVMAIIAGFVLAAILLPLLELQSSIG